MGQTMTDNYTENMLTLSGNVGADEQIRAADALLNRLRAAGQDLAAFADTPVGKLQRARAADAVWREAEKGLGPIIAYLKTFEGYRLTDYAHLRNRVLSPQAGSDRALEAEREAEIRQHYRAMPVAVDRAMALEAAAAAGDSRTIRALVAQNPSLPLIDQDTLDRCVQRCVQAAFPKEWQQIATSEGNEALVRLAVQKTESEITRWVGPRPLGAAQ